ncbi:MAG: antitoxin family protein [Pirellulales bacterium]|nr:antitoxin family protein [Pirellulales bacterium]
MSLTIEATYEDGVLKPKQPLPLEEHTEVRITIDIETSRARRTAGLMGWTGSVELADRIALDPELALEEGA